MAQESKKILIVDDQENIRKILSKMLRDTGYYTLTVANGQEALSAIQKEYFDLIISDINMPVMDGLTFLKNFKEMGIETPVIFITGEEHSSSLQEGLKLGLIGFIEKPFNLETTIQIIKEKIG